MVCVQKSPALALLHQQRKYKTLSISTAQVLSGRGPKIWVFFIPLPETVFLSKTLISLISSLKNKRYFLALFRRAKASARRTWARGLEAQDTREKITAVRG